jgi:hypothetical protein
MIYVGSPYTHTNKFIQEKRYLDVSVFTGELMKNGLTVFSPIAHCHDIARYCTLPTNYEFWENYCLRMMDVASAMVVLQLDGWDLSRGLTSEIRYATHLGIPISYERMPHG